MGSKKRRNHRRWHIRGTGSRLAPIGNRRTSTIYKRGEEEIDRKGRRWMRLLERSHGRFSCAKIGVVSWRHEVVLANFDGDFMWVDKRTLDMFSKESGT